MSFEELAPLFAELGVDLPGLLVLPASLVEAAVCQAAASNAERAALHVALSRARALSTAPVSEGQALRDFFSAQEAREEQPWRREARRAELHLEAFSRGFCAEDPWTPLRADFAARARAGLFSEEEALLLHYLLAPPPADPERARYDLACLLLSVPPPARLAVHNWRAASAWNPARREANGEAIARLGRPLFPDAPGFDSLNAQLLSEALGVEGGGPGPCAPPRGFSSSSSVLPRRPRPSSVPVSGGVAVPFFGADGLQTAVADTAALDAALAAEFASLRALLVPRGRGRGYGRGRGAWQGGRGQQQQQQQHHQHQQQHQQQQQQHQQQTKNW